MITLDEFVAKYHNQTHVLDQIGQVPKKYRDLLSYGLRSWISTIYFYIDHQESPYPIVIDSYLLKNWITFLLRVNKSSESDVRPWLAWYFSLWGCGNASKLNPGWETYSSFVLSRYMLLVRIRGFMNSKNFLFLSAAKSGIFSSSNCLSSS